MLRNIHCNTLELHPTEDITKLTQNKMGENLKNT